MVEPFCPRCGAAQDPSNVFCPKCGHGLLAEQREEAAQEVPGKAEPESGSGSEPAAQSTVADDLWFRLRSEEQEYTRRSRRNARIGCLVLLVVLVGFVIAIWHWSPPVH